MQVKAFLTKLKSLIKKISRSSNTQIQSHTSTCHRLISQLIKDDELLTTMNAQKLRLLAYESILYLVQVLDYKKDSGKCTQSMNEKGKINSYLGEINSTLIEVKELLKKCDREALSRGHQGYLLSMEAVTSMDRNLNQYAYRLGAIFTELQNQHNKPNQSPPSSSTSLCYLKPTNSNYPQDYRDSIIQQMQRVVQKKQKLISQLMNERIRAQNQKLQSQNDYMKYQQLSREKNDEVVKELVEMNKQLQRELEENVRRRLNEEGVRRLVVQSAVVNVKLLQCEKQYNNNNNYQSCIINNNNNNNNNKAFIQSLNDQTINSVPQLHHNRYSPMRKPSLHRVSSTQSFKRYDNFEQKQNGFIVQKRARQLISNNQHLYMLLLCQASTIEEIL